jgi:electron transport complex protein RnfB
MDDAADVYRRLQRHLDQLPIGFPATASGVELRILARLFPPEEAELALRLSALPEPVETIAGRAAGWTQAELSARLEGLAKKGAIFGVGRAGARRYAKAPLAIGIYEMQVDRLTRELQADFEQYAREGFGQAFLGVKTKQMRTVPVNARFVADRVVGRYDDARALLGGGRGPWAVLNCVCRQGRELLGEPCRQTDVRRTCLAIGPAAKATIASGAGEPASRDEVLALVDRAEADGMVLQPSNTREPVFMCFCCGCCCGVLRTAKQFPRPAEYVASNHHALVDASLCSGCEACHARCPMDALRTVDGASVVDLDRCIGCGACVGGCPAEAICLAPNPGASAPPRDLRSLYARISVERFGLVGTAVKLGRALLHRPV